MLELLEDYIKAFRLQLWVP